MSMYKITPSHQKVRTDMQSINKLNIFTMATSCGTCYQPEALLSHLHAWLTILFSSALVQWPTTTQCVTFSINTAGLKIEGVLKWRGLTTQGPLYIEQIFENVLYEETVEGFLKFGQQNSSTMNQGVRSPLTFTKATSVLLPWFLYQTGRACHIGNAVRLLGRLCITLLFPVIKFPMST